ncbi:MAG: hypothetical protein ACFFCZ_06070 [Promethearchaeota archaeon]
MIQKLRLNQDQERVLLLLLSVGSLDESELSTFLRYDREKVRSTCQELEREGYARKVPGIGSRWAASYPFKALSAENEQLLEKMQEIGKEIDRFTTERFKILEDIVTTTEEKVVASIENGKTRATQTKTNTIQSLETQLQAEKAKIPQHKLRGEEEIGKILENQDLEEKKAFEEFVEMVNKQSQEKEGTILQTLQQNSDSAKTQSEALIPVKKQQITEFEQKMEEIGTNYVTEGKNFAEKTRASLENEKNDLFAKIDSIREQTVQQENQIVDQIKLDKKTLMDETKTKNSEIMNEFHGKVTGKTIQFEESVKNSSTENIRLGKEKIQELKTNFETEIQEVRNQASSILTQLSQNVQNVSSTFTEEAKALTQDFLEKSLNLASNFDTKAQSTVSDAERKINELIDRSQEISKTFESNSISKLEEIEEAIRTALGTTVNDHRTFLDETKNTTISELYESLQQANDKMNEQLMNFLGKATDSLNQTVTITKEHTENFATGTNNDFNNLFTALNSAITDNKTHAKTIMSEEMTTFEKLVQDLVNLITTASTTMSELVSSQYNNWRSESADLSKQTIEKASMVRSNARSETVSAIEKILLDTEGTIDLGMKILTSSLDQVENETHSALDEASGSVKAEIGKEITDLKTGVEGFGEQFTKSAQTLRTVLTDFDKEITDLSERIARTQLPNYNAIPILGQNAVLDYISEMFDRVKSGITILIPNPDQIPIEKIEASKTTQRVTIVTNATPETHEDLIRRLLTRPNVRVRNLTASKELSVNIAAEREGEEVLISTAHGDATIGFASTGEDYIKLFGKVVIGDFFLAQSREIKRSDVGL